MILDQLAHWQSYAHLSPSFKAGFEYLQTFDPGTPLGRYDIVGNDVFALVQSYETQPAENRKFESHKTFADIQYIVRGEEVIEYSRLENLPVTQPYSAEHDAALYGHASAPTQLVLQAGDFAVFYPQDGHKPGCTYQQAETILKVVVKVRL